MQTASCTVRLGGSLLNTVTKKLVTPPELALLQAIHGRGSIVDVKLIAEDRRDHRVERERLERIYGKSKGADDRRVIDLVFPGIQAKLPTTLEEVGFGGAEESEPAPKKKKGAAKEITADDLGDDELAAAEAEVAAGGRK